MLDGVNAATVDSYMVTRGNEGASKHTVAKELGALRGVLRTARGAFGLELWPTLESH